jgi:hypothetical protein
MLRDIKAILTASNNAVKSAAILRWLEEKPDQEQWNTWARLNGNSTKNASKV